MHRLDKTNKLSWLVISAAAVMASPVGGIGLALAADQTAKEEEPDDYRVEEVVVTAQKRGGISVQRTPMSVRAITGATLRDKNAEDFVDFARLVPGLSTEDQGPGEKRLIIRGVRAEGPSTVGVYWNDAVITGSNTEDDGGGRNPDIRLYDLERIEVLRGPQGTLYGANSFSGTIRFITNKPDATEVSGSIETEFANTRFGDESYKVNGHLNLPIVQDKAAIRGVAYYEDEGGFIDNVRLGIEDENEQETYGGRLALRVLATDRLTLDGSIVLQRTDLGGKQRFFPNVGDLETDVFVVDKFEDELELYQLAAEYQFNVGSLHVSSGFLNRDIFFRFDSTPILQVFGVPLPFAIAVTDQPDKREIWSNEIRFSSNFSGPVQFVAGLFHQKTEKDFESNVISATEDGVPTGDEPDIFGRLSRFDKRQFAVFGEATYQLTDKVSVLAGMRFFDFDQDKESRETVPFFDPGASPPPDPDRSASESDVTLKFSISYQATEDAMLYALASEGFREGGTNSTGFGAMIEIPEEFDSDSIWNFEVGAKTSWYSGRLLTNLSVYFIDWDDMQVEQQEPVQGFPFIGNAGAARVRGLELEISAQPLPGLTIDVAAGYQDAELTEDQPLLEIDVEAGRDGDPVPFVPDFTGAVSVQYEFPVYGGWNGFVRSDFSYTDESFTQFNSNSQFFNRQDSYAITDIRVGLRGNGWNVMAYGDNLFDKRADLTIIETIAVPQSVFTNRPRTFGISVGREF